MSKSFDALTASYKRPQCSTKFRDTSPLSSHDTVVLLQFLVWRNGPGTGQVTYHFLPSTAIPPCCGLVAHG